jgi:hypothetical protein
MAKIVARFGQVFLILRRVLLIQKVLFAEQSQFLLCKGQKNKAKTKPIFAQNKPIFKTKMPETYVNLPNLRINSLP